MQLNKNIKIFINYFLGPLLFIWLAYAVYRDIIHQPRLEESWLQIKQSLYSYKVTTLVIALFLILVNWGLEAWKWKLSIAGIYSIKFLTAFRAVLSGVAFSVTMPNRVGEYLGRIMYLPEGQRLKTISVTLVCSFAQLIVTIAAGTAGLFFLKNDLIKHIPSLFLWYPFVFYGLVVFILLLLLIYFNAAGTVELFKRYIKLDKYIYLVEALRKFNVQLLIQLLLLSILRYIVFLVQYLLIFTLFNVSISAGTGSALMSIVFLIMAIVPSVALAEVGLRGELMIRLLGWFASNILGIGLASVTVWFINLILPAIIGSLLLLNLRVFNKRNEVV